MTLSLARLAEAEKVTLRTWADARTLSGYCHVCGRGRGSKHADTCPKVLAVRLLDAYEALEKDMAFISAEHDKEVARADAAKPTRGQVAEALRYPIGMGPAANACAVLLAAGLIREDDPTGGAR